jgi:hypothetical protein
MPTVRQAVRRDFESGDLDEDSDLARVRGIGGYIRGRVQRYLGVQGPMTIGRLWKGTRRMNDAQIRRFLLRSLQNRRGNQCVSGRTRRSPDPTYHTQDVNQHAYEAVVALLDRGRNRRGGVAYGPLVQRMPTRTAASKGCGCRLRCDGPCTRNADGACVPRRGGGFWGSPPHPDQIVRATTEAERRRVKNAARTRMTRVARADADSMQDVRSGHRKSMRYSPRGHRMFRVPSPKVRLPSP